MGRYGDLNKDKNEILIQLYKSQEIAKLMVIKDNPLSQPDFENIPITLSGLIKTAFYYPKAEDPRCKITILFNNLDSVGGRTFKSCIIDINIMVHEDWWEDKGIVRAWVIADKIDELLTDNFKLSMGGLQSIGGRGYFDIANGNAFKGFNIRYKSVDFS